MFDFDDLIDILDGEEFEERPVDVRDFVTKEDYLGLPPLSEYQYTLIRASSQIYKKSTLEKLYGEDLGIARWKETVNEVIAQLGKGSGKDYCSTIAVAYIVYLLLCLKDPAKYFGKPPGDSIDIINIAINSQQAKNVFFKGLKNRVDKSPWFAGKYIAKADVIEFDKGVSCHSGHSEREAFEGYNTLVVILDEISGFSIDNTTGHEQAKTAGAIYDMYRASVDSRFPDFGKVILLSFPRYKNDYIQQRYNAVIAEKETIIRSHKFKMVEELEDGKSGNEFSIDWEEDNIVSYKYPKVYALRRPTWEVNPTRSIEDFKVAFYTNPTDALARFACMPPEAVDAFFKSREKIEKAFVGKNGVDEMGRFEEFFTPNQDVDYFVHVDLAQKHDHCAVAMSHVSHWVKIRSFNDYEQVAPVVVVDAVRWWTPTADKSVDFTEVKDYIISLRSRGFNVRAVTFDRWNSHDMMQQIKNYNINTEILSVAKRHYEDMALGIMEERITGPDIKLLIDELLQLRIMRDKVDHPRKGSKDLADAVCGSIYNAISRSAKGDRVIEVHTWAETVDDNTHVHTTKDGVPKRMPEELYDAIRGMSIL
mgnify:CR=1 FL=1|jgi:hypothetical protein